jgi:hypothetical protein
MGKRWEIGHQVGFGILDVEADGNMNFSYMSLPLAPVR